MKGVKFHAAQLITGAGLVALLPRRPWLSRSAPRRRSLSRRTFVVTDDAQVTGDSAYLDNGATNSLPQALLFVTLNDTPGGVCGCALVEKPLGVWYDSSRAQWAVFTEDVSAMPSTPSFNVLVVPRSSRTANLSPDGKSRPGDRHPLEVAYSDPGSKIFRETINNSDFTVPPLNATFNLLIFSS